MGERTIEKIVVYSALEPTPEEQRDGIVYQPDGELTHPELIDEVIEDKKFRSGMLPNAGNISITVLAGEELGDISVNVQFEGKHKLYDQCLRNQGDLFDAASVWLGDLLEELGGDFDIVIEAKPCPHTGERLPLKHSADNLVGWKRTEETVDPVTVQGLAVNQHEANAQ